MKNKRTLIRKGSHIHPVDKFPQKLMLLKYAFLADTVTLDAAGKLNAIGIFDIIFARQLPLVHRDMTLVIKIEGIVAEKGEHKLSVELRDKDANKLLSYDQNIRLQEHGVSQGILAANAVARLQDIQFNKAGQYEFVMFINGRFLGRSLFRVQEIQIKGAGDA